MAEDKDKKDPTLKMVGPGAADVDTGATDDDDTRGQLADGEAARDEDDEREAPTGERDDRDEDERVGAGDENSDERRAIREHRRQQRHAKRERNQRDQRELRFLRDRNEALERRFSEQDARISQTEVAAVDQRINQLQGLIDLADRTHAEAITAQKGDEASEALKIRSDLKSQLDQAEGLKRQLADGSRTRREAPRIDPAIAAEAQDWMDRNSWFDPRLTDEDSAIAKAVEQTLSRDRRFDPRSAEYWEELDDRLAKRLPHLYENAGGSNGDARRNGRDRERDDEDDDEEARGARRERPRGGGPRITTGGRERPLRRGEVYVDAERRAAMEKAGVWDDPVLREKYLRSYQKYDAEHGVRRRA